MCGSYQYLQVERRGDIFCAQIKDQHFDEFQTLQMCEELSNLITNDNCRKLAVSLGPGSPVFLYSVLLAKLFVLQRRLQEDGGSMVLCGVSPQVMTVFKTCAFDDKFRFARTFDDAVAQWEQTDG
jgi:hypothetical protein